MCKKCAVDLSTKDTQRDNNGECGAIFMTKRLFCALDSAVPSITQFGRKPLCILMVLYLEWTSTLQIDGSPYFRVAVIFYFDNHR